MARINAKPMIRCSRAVAYAVESLSKTLIADVLINRVYAELGYDGITDDAILAKLQTWFKPVAILRGDKMPSLKRRKMYFDKTEKKYLDNHQTF